MPYANKEDKRAYERALKRKRPGRKRTLKLDTLADQKRMAKSHLRRYVLKCSFTEMDREIIALWALTSLLGRKINQCK